MRLKRWSAGWLVRPELLRLVRATPAVSRDADADLGVYDPERVRKVALVTVLELEKAALVSAIEASCAALSRYDKVVYVSDCPDFTPFRERRCLFEYVPPLADQERYGAGRHWGLFLQERYDLLIAKWRPLVVLAYGTPFERFVAAADGAAKPDSEGGAKAALAEARTQLVDIGRSG